ncbi:transcription termination/antitermination protein NusG [Synechococcus sp. PCC 7336]|uniref:transcription termination/antitermination protein NusG n=1 Tax=Synechococcus sp. PCC 7336 TaxID=195250 RepID=UPI00056FCF3C|nr:transcription termination/antitermination protein NusG [Synechococcus sp. PCC 7336]
MVSTTEHEEHSEEKRQERWYTVQVASGCENKVQSTLMQRAIALDVQDRILEVAIPKRPGYKVGKDGKRQQIEEKIFPGYVLIRMVLDDEVWQVIKSTPNVINFVGNEERRAVGRGRGHVTPRPLSASEVHRIFKTAEVEEVTVKVDMAEGDKIEVLSGPFQGFHGEVVEVSPERGKLKALISIFGRDTPVELEFNQVEKEV